MVTLQELLVGSCCSGWVMMIIAGCCVGEAGPSYVPRLPGVTVLGSPARFCRMELHWQGSNRWSVDMSLRTIPPASLIQEVTQFHSATSGPVTSSSVNTAFPVKLHPATLPRTQAHLGSRGTEESPSSTLQHPGITIIGHLKSQEPTRRSCSLTRWATPPGPDCNKNQPWKLFYTSVKKVFLSELFEGI